MTYRQALEHFYEHATSDPACTACSTLIVRSLCSTPDEKNSGAPSAERTTTTDETGKVLVKLGLRPGEAQALIRKIHNPGMSVAELVSAALRAR